MQPEALNAVAYVIARIVERDPSAASIGDAEDMIRRATRLIERQRTGDCTLSDFESTKLAKFYDTVREIEEIQGDTAAALEAQRQALALLPASELERERREKYTKIVERLEAELAGR